MNANGKKAGVAGSIPNLDLKTQGPREWRQRIPDDEADIAYKGESKSR